jgi:cytochrome c biogenesis protein CcmG/thiol:disulfide interchange protein DsbE
MIRRFFPLAAFLVIAALLFVGVRMNSGQDSSAIPSPLIGKPAPAFALPVLGEPTRIVSKRDLLGAPYLLNVWGSWCPSCRDEHPVLSAYAARGKIRILGYNYKDAPEDAARWLAEFGNPYALIVADEAGRAALDWGIYGAPETFLIDADGIVRWKTVGSITEAIVREQIEPELAKLSAAP